MTDNLADLDKGGTNAQFVRTWLGPTLGWAMLPVTPELIFSSGGALVLPAYASRVLLKAAVTPITLPSVAQWMTAALPLGNTAGFDRSLFIKDLSGLPTPGSPFLINRSGTDTIDGLTQWKITNANQLVRLYPLSDLSGWFVG